MTSVFDNGGETMDRYTVFVTYDTGEQFAYGMSDNASDPNGFNQYIGEAPFDIEPGSHLGERLTRVPVTIRGAVEDRIDRDGFALEHDLNMTNS